MVHSIEVNAVANRETKCLPLFALVIVFLSFILEYSDGLGIPGTGQLVQPFRRCGFTILFWFLISGTLTKSLFVAFVFAVGTKFFLYLGTGLMTQALMDVMICIALLLYLGKIRWVILSSVLFLITLTGYNNIKCFHASGNTPTTLSGVVTSSCYTAKFETSAKSVARRSTHLHLLQHVIQSSWDSEFESPTRPFFRAVLNHIPRAIWKDKPRETLGNKFGKKYKIIFKSDNRTSWNVPWMSDFYTSGGYPVVLIYGLATGILIGVGVSWISTQRQKMFGFGLYTATLFPLFYQEANFSLMTGSLLWVTAFLIALFSITNRLVKVIENRE